MPSDPNTIPAELLRRAEACGLVRYDSSFTVQWCRDNGVAVWRDAEGVFHSKVPPELRVRWSDPTEALALERVVCHLEGQLGSAQGVKYVCGRCGCMWRDNGDETMSLYDQDQRSCSVCEFQGIAELIPSPPRTYTEGTLRVTRERLRQIEREGWTPEHDAEHDGGSLAEAAVMYARYGYGPLHPAGSPPLGWPWHKDWWKPTPGDRVRALEKAGALIAAEIDRLLWLNRHHARTDHPVVPPSHLERQRRGEGEVPEGWHSGDPVPEEVHERGWQWRPVRDSAFAPPFGTIRVCTECGCLVAGGPTRCVRCVRALAADAALAAQEQKKADEMERDIFSKVDRPQAIHEHTSGDAVGFRDEDGRVKQMWHDPNLHRHDIPAPVGRWETQCFVGSVERQSYPDGWEPLAPLFFPNTTTLHVLCRRRVT